MTGKANVGRKTRISINPEVASECAAAGASASESLQSNHICAPTRTGSHCHSRWRISEKHNEALTPLAAVTVPVTAAAPAGLRVAGGVGSQVYNCSGALASISDASAVCYCPG